MTYPRVICDSCDAVLFDKATGERAQRFEISLGSVGRVSTYDFCSKCYNKHFEPLRASLFSQRILCSLPEVAQ